MRFLESVVGDADAVRRSLEEAEGRGFVVKLKAKQPSTHKFVHDKVQQAAYELMLSSEEVQRTHWKIGKSLWREYDDGELSNHAVVVAGQLRRSLSLITKDADRVAFCRLSLLAAQN